MRPQAVGAGYHHQAIDDGALLEALGECFAATRHAGEGRWVAPPPEEGRDVTSLDALRTAMAGGDRSDVRTVEGLARCLVFNATGLPGSVVDATATAARHPVDRLVEMLAADLPGAGQQQAVVSGHFLYPPGAYMGWHTNDRVPGRRLYLSVVEVPGRSGFCFRDPDTAEIVTSHDTGADLRSFDIDPGRPLWHAVWSDTWRLSIGYRILDGEPPAGAVGR